MIARIWGGIVAAMRFGNRCLEIFLALTLAFNVLLYLAGSGHAGHFLNEREFIALMADAYVWPLEGWWR
jgi:hypothetical protein